MAAQTDIRENQLDTKAEFGQFENTETVALTEHEKRLSKKLVRKIDLLIMPAILIIYIMNWIDRNNYAAARLQGLESDLGLVGNQYQTGLSILFVGYILGQIPSNLLLNYCGRPSLYLGFFTIAWGTVSALTALVTNFGSIMACRFILGIVEAPFFPGVLFYLSRWYTKEEINFRMSIFYSGALIAGAFGNLIAAGILHGLEGHAGLASWQWLYIIEGVVTVFFGICTCFILPDFPQTWRALSPELKHIAIRRLTIEAAQADVDEEGAKAQLRGLALAFADIKVYIFAVAYLAITGAIGFQNFFPTLTRTLGYSRFISLLLVAPPYIFITIWSYFHGLISDRVQNRFWFFVYPVPVSIAGFLIFMTTESFGPRYFACFLMTFVLTMNGTIYAWIASSIPRPPAKRAAAYAFINSLGNSASIWTPFTYREEDKPFYRPALGICIGLQVIAAVCAVVMRLYLQRENKQFARMEMENDGQPLGEADLARLQKTTQAEGIAVAEARAMEKGFRYQL
ncbi:uncharacterized protein A1O9_04221 [Exophiala aquamarina CBS 119918]|uniref:Major facilitator superfamily (MFS) profile domain-containing protein n=1 Tax=Exophiala aquamarina CBS 119918 TaxID=1182545 RepID=A0A072PI14_9EURO|nr:uncharacterized protein A1O9_04221 [Exophiala aquamarina CBS 119918]KEF59377.1 hypothetical protein A1O9_04221 [Exophiala aquamarina CBS 119918]